VSSNQSILLAPSNNSMQVSVTWINRGKEVSEKQMEEIIARASSDKRCFHISMAIFQHEITVSRFKWETNGGIHNTSNLWQAMFYQWPFFSTKLQFLGYYTKQSRNWSIKTTDVSLTFWARALICGWGGTTDWRGNSQKCKLLNISKSKTAEVINRLKQQIRPWAKGIKKVLNWVLSED
jgi:hypothetical protein